MPIKIKSAGGGSITLDLPSTAVDTTLFLPTANGAAIYSNTNTAFSGNVAVSGANSYISVNGDNLSPYAMRNRIINGDFRIFQRNAGAATLVTNNGVGYTGPDRFFIYQNGTLGVQSSQVASGLTGYQYALKWGRPTSNTTTGVTVLGQTLETTNSIDLQGQQVTLSFWAKAGANFSAASSQIYVAVYSGTGTDQSASSMTTASWTGSATPISTMVTLTTTWQKFTLTGTLGSTVSQLGLYMNWSPVGTAGADDYVYITGVQLEQGPIATPFERRLYSMELSLCHRYYYRLTNPGNYTYIGNGRSINATYGDVLVHVPVPMRITPVLGYSSLSHLQCNFASTLTLFSLGGSQSGLPTTGYLHSVGPGSATAGLVQMLQFNNASTSAWVDWSAEL